MKNIIQGVDIKYISAVVPSNEIDLLTFSDIYGIKEVKKIIKSTGISKIRVAADSRTASDLCYEASQIILTRGDVSAAQIDGIIFVSQTPDYILPATSVVLQDRLGLPKESVAFDIPFGCSGYIYGLFQAAMLLNTNSCSNVLLLAGDVITPYINKGDRSVRMVFGDGGSATLLSRGSGGCGFVIKTDGSGATSLIIPAGGAKSPYSDGIGVAVEKENKNFRSENDLYMNGIDIIPPTR